MDRRVTPPKRVTSPTWGSPPPCKQALKMCVTSLLCSPRADLWPFYGFLCKYELAHAHITYYDKFSLPYLNMHKALKNSTPYCSF